MSDKKQQKVEAVERALTILDAFSDGSDRLTLNDLALRTGLYRSTILRIAASLERFDYLIRETDGHFRLGSSLFRLGTVYQRSFNLADAVRPVLRRLVEETGETAAFYIRDGDHRICLFRHHAQRVFRYHLDEGAQLTLDRGASAHILMAFTAAKGKFYDKVRKDGFIFSEGEREPDVTALAVPVFGLDNILVGALGIVGGRERFDAAARRKFLSIIQEKASQLSARLGARPGK